MTRKLWRERIFDIATGDAPWKDLNDVMIGIYVRLFLIGAGALLAGAFLLGRFLR
jgi:hypothetical protein